MDEATAINEESPSRMTSTLSNRGLSYQVIGAPRTAGSLRGRLAETQPRPVPELSVVMPAFNEAETVADVIKTHRDIARSIASSFEMLVCDDGSTDRTWKTLETCASNMPELILVRNATNLGIPATMKRLYGASRGEWIYFTPADGQVPAAALKAMWAARDGASLVVGRRIPRRDPASRVLIAQLYSAGLRVLFRLPVYDIDGVKLYRAADLRAVDISSASNFFEAEILIKLCRAGKPVREVCVPHRPRVTGRAGGVTASAAFDAIRDVAAFAVRMHISDPARDVQRVTR